MPDRSRLPLTVPALLGGAVTGAVGSLVHRAETGPVPVGLVLALLLTTLAAVAGRALLGRLGAAASAVGWLAPVLAFSTPRPEGDLLVDAGTQGSLWLLGGTVLHALAVIRGYAPAASAPPPAGR